MNWTVVNIHLKLKKLVNTGNLNTLEKGIENGQANLSQNNTKGSETRGIRELKNVGKTLVKK